MENRIEEPERPLNKITVAVAVGAIAAYIGLLALEAADSDNKSDYITETPAKVQNKAENTASKVPDKDKKVSIRKLTSRDLPEVNEYLEQIFEHARAHGNEVLTESCSGISGKFSSHGMIAPPSYTATKCFADTGLNLYRKNQDAVYLELANYYYRRCLYLINGQFMGRFRKPAGGNDEIKKRQIDVFEAMDEIAAMTVQ